MRQYDPRHSASLLVGASKFFSQHVCLPSLLLLGTAMNTRTSIYRTQLQFNQVSTENISYYLYPQTVPKSGIYCALRLTCCDICGHEVSHIQPCDIMAKRYYTYNKHVSCVANKCRFNNKHVTYAAYT